MTTYLEKMRAVINEATRDNLGDVVQQAFDLAHAGPHSPEHFTEQDYMEFARIMHSLYDLASHADLGWKLFDQVDMPRTALTDGQAMQLVGVSTALRQIAYCFTALEGIDQAGVWGGTAVLFYINSICSNVTAWFLLDEASNRREGFSKTGSVIRILEPLGLAQMLDSVFVVLDKKIGNLTLGNAILQIRNQNLVHNRFLPKDLKQIWTHAGLHEKKNKLLWNALLNELGDAILILQLKIIAIFNASGRDLRVTFRDYMDKLLGPDFEIPGL